MSLILIAIANLPSKEDAPIDDPAHKGQNFLLPTHFPTLLAN